MALGCGRPGKRRRRSGPCLLWLRRSARGHRRQCADRAARPEFFSPRSGPWGDRPLDLRGGRREIRRALKSPRSASRPRRSPKASRIATENMANAIKTIKRPARANDVTGYRLTVFRAWRAACPAPLPTMLGMTTCLIHPMALCFLAHGMGFRRYPRHADPGGRGLLDAAGRLAAAAPLDRLGVEALAEVEAQGVSSRGSAERRFGSRSRARHRPADPLRRPTAMGRASPPPTAPVSA